MARTLRSRLIRRTTVVAIFVAVTATSTIASAAFSGVGATSTGSYTAGTINPPTAFATSSVTPTSALLSWSAPTSPSETSYILSQSPGTMTGCSATPTAGTTSCTASGLTPNTSYTWTLTALYDNWQSTTVTVGVTTPKATPTITTAANPASDTVGGSVDDQAFVTGGYDPTGSITWSLYNNSGCTGTAVFSTSDGGPVMGDSTYSSAYYTTTAAATYTWGINYVGDNYNFGVSACGGTNETLTVNPATPTLSTSASSGGDIGGTVSDSANLAGAYDPTGTITYTLYGPSATQSCATQVGQVTSAVNAGNTTYTSPTITPTQAGTYWWIANYGGDSNNLQTTNGCGESGESSVVNPVTPTITTAATPAMVTQSGSVVDKATFIGGYSEMGSITWSLYNNSGCTGLAVFTSTAQSVNGDSTYTSSPYTTTSAGTYTWGFSYTGDVNNNPVSACGGTGETLIVQNATSLTSLTAPATGTTNTSISGSSLGVTLSGGTTSNPPGVVSGAITFSVFGPQTSAPTSCTGGTLTPATTVSSGNGTYAGSVSASYTPTAPGTYWWYASYGGDTYNVASSTLCGPGMTSTVVKTTTSTGLSSITPTTGNAGTSFSATATVTGTSPIGTVIFSLYTFSNCSLGGSASYSTAALPLSSGSITGSLTPAHGTYYWQAVYGGDTFNYASKSACSAAITVNYANNVVDLYNEVNAYNATHTSNVSSNIATDFSFFASASKYQGGTIDWTGKDLADLTMFPMTYTASTSSNGMWNSSGNAGPIGPFTTSPFSGVSATPGPTNNGGNQGHAAVVKLTIPASPSGSYQTGATVKVQAMWTAGSTVWVYLLTSTGATVSGTNPVQVTSSASMNSTFSIATPSAGTVYYVAVAPNDSTTTAVDLDVTATLPYG